MNSEAKSSSAKTTSIQHFLSQQKGLLTRLVLLAVAVLLTGQIAVSLFALAGFERELEPQLNQKANAVGYAISSQLSFAIEDLEIPPDQLVGIEPYFDNYLNSNADIEYLALIDNSGNVLFLRGIMPEVMDKVLAGIPSDTSGESNFQVHVDGYVNGAFPVQENISGSTVLHVGVSSEHIRNQFSEIIYEVITVIAISWLVTFEFLVFFMGTRVSQPMEQIRRVLAEGTRGIFANRLIVRTRDEVGQLISSFNRMVHDLQNRYTDFVFEARELRDAQIDGGIAKKISGVVEQFDRKFVFTGGVDVRTKNVTQIRVPLFLFIFSEELSRSFLPLFVSKYAPQDILISHDLLIGLPITLFMLAVMVVTPFGGGFVDRFGVRRVFLAGVAFAAVGFIGNFLTQSYVDLVIYRIITGIGYSLVFISSEGWVVQNAEKYKRTASTGVFVTAVFVGIVCGPPIGGILANRIGFEATFLISALLAIVSGFIVYQIFRDTEAPEGSQQTRLLLGSKDVLTLLKDSRFVAVLLFSAVPGKMMLAGFIAYLVPLYLNELGHNQSSIGRIMMLYGLATISLVFVAARFADHTKKLNLVVFVGGTITGVGCIASYFAGNFGFTDSGAVIVAILSLGVGHALTMAPQNAIILQVAELYRNSMGRASVVSTYRLIDRLGMVIGPLVAVLLISVFGYRGAIAVFGCIILGLIVLFLIVMITPNSKRAMRIADRLADA